MQELDIFLGLLLAMGVAPQNTLKAYWQRPSADQVTGSAFFYPRMTFDRFIEIYRCLDFQLNALTKLIRSKIQEMWVPSYNLCLDETMVPHQGKHNPHHVYIERKPNPHGMKYYTLADDSRYYYNFLLHKRTDDDHGEKNDITLMNNGKGNEWVRGEPLPKEPGKTVKVVLHLLGGLEPDHHHMVLDSYYGGVQLLQALRSRGFHVTTTCQRNRPSFLFASYLAAHRGLRVYGASAHCSATLPAQEEVDTEEDNDEEEEENTGSGSEDDVDAVEIEEELHDGDANEDELEEDDYNDDLDDLEVQEFDVNAEDYPFSAVAFKGARTMFLLSTVCEAHEMVEREETARNREDGTSTSKIMEVPRIRDLYLESMNYIDQANNEVLSCRFKHRISRWKIAILIFFIRMLIQNSRVTYNHFQEEKSTVDFIKDLSAALAGDGSAPTADLARHELAHNNKRRRCALCWSNGKNSQSLYYCTGCKCQMHKSCFDSFYHAVFAASRVEGEISGEERVKGKEKIKKRRKKKGREIFFFFSEKNPTIFPPRFHWKSIAILFRNSTKKKPKDDHRDELFPKNDVILKGFQE